MELPASHYGKLDKRNPVIIGFVREIHSFIAVMKKVACSPSQDETSGCVKGVKMLMDIWKKYKPRLPPSLYQEHMLQVADVLFELKFHEMALWYGYRLYLQLYTSVDLVDIEDMKHFKACFFPEGLDTDHDTLVLKIRALHGCALCTFEQVKTQDILTSGALYKLLCVLDIIRYIMQVFQHYDSLCWQIYNGSLLIYNICRFLMTKNHSAQALEYLLWASFSIELSVPLMTSDTLPWLVTLYCAVCQCYYDNQAAVHGEVFARRALVKINELANSEEQCGIPSSKDKRKTFKEASIKLAAMIFKRAVFEARTKSLRSKIKRKLSEIPNVPWPRNTTEQILCSLFEGGAAQFLGILEALRDNTRSLPQTGGSDDLEVQEVVLELLAAGISLLSDSELKSECQSPGSLGAVTASASQIDLAIAGKNKICFEAALEFIKQLYYYKQPEAFTEYLREMLQLLLVLKDPSLQTAELELRLLCYNNHVQKERLKSAMSVSDEFIELVKTLHKYICDSDSAPNKDLALAIILFVWDKVSSVIDGAQQHRSESKKLDKGVWCLSVLCDVAFAFDMCSTNYFMMTGEMVLKLVMLLERAAKHKQKHAPEVKIEEDDAGKFSSFSLSKSSSAQLLQKLCDVIKKWFKAFSKGMGTMLPQDGSALFDLAYMQKHATQPSPNFDKEEDTEDISTNVETINTWRKHDFLLAVDLHLHLNAIYYRASLSLVQSNAAQEFEILQQIKKNKISRAVFLMQKALMEYNTDPESPNIKNLLEESAELIRKATLEERKLFMSTNPTKGRGINDEKNSPPPAPVLVSRSDHSLSFVPSPYCKKQVCWYQLLGHSAEGTNLKVRLGDCSLAGTGRVIPADCGRCVLTVEGLDPNQKYVFAVAAYNSQGDLVGNSIGETTIPILASPPLPLLSTWALLAQVAFQTKQYDVAKRACQKLWSHFAHAEPRPNNTQYELVIPRLQVPTLHLSSLALRQLVFASIFIETEINIQRSSLQWNLVSDRGLFIWTQIVRLEECERMLAAIDLLPWLLDHSDALQAVIVCYVLLIPFIYHQISCSPVIQVLTKCINVLEKNIPQLKVKWTGITSEALMHRIACITYYLYKALHNHQEKEKAAALMDSGVNLINEIYFSQNKHFPNPITKKADPALKSERKMSSQLKALLGKNKNKTIDGLGTTTCNEDQSKMYDVFSSTPIKRAFQEAMKLTQKPIFIEASTLLLQRALDEGEAALVIEWEQPCMDQLRKLTTRSQYNTKGGVFGNESQDDAKRKLRQGLIHKAKPSSEKRFGKYMNRFKKRVILRQMHFEESVWRTKLNFALAQAHLAQFYKSHDQLHKGPRLDRYSQLDHLSSSMAYSGVSLRMKRNLHHRLDNSVLERDITRDGETEAQEPDESNSHIEVTEENDSKQPLEAEKQAAAFMLESLTKAALHLRRTMVLAHRSSHWAMLRSAGQTVWDQYCRTAWIVQRGAHLELSLFITSEQQLNIFDPLLVLATELIMDMLSGLGLWSVYSKDLSDMEAQSCLCFFVHLDEATKIDMRWMKTLVIHTLEHLHDSGKWETLAHLALQFNTYTQDHYALIVSPLLINAQRKLLERIQSVQGPSVLQPHHVRTKEVTGQEISQLAGVVPPSELETEYSSQGNQDNSEKTKVTYKSYVSTQLLSGWTPTQKEPILKKDACSRNRLIDAEVQRSMALVCVPLDVEDTLFWYRKAVERRSPCLEFFQHTRSHLQRLLANMQPYYKMQIVQSVEPSRSKSVVQFSPLMITAPTVKPCDLMKEDYRTIESLYSLPLSPEHVPTITAAYTTAINYFHENKCDYLTVVALHELGNLHYYNGNAKAAHACWAKAINCALKSPDALETWDGVTFGGCSLQQRLQLSGVWGCLQAALLTAKIAQYILTTDISKRTNFCLQSAHLFKCVLCCSLAQPLADLHYASGLTIHGLLPGVDLFSDPSRVHLGTTVTCLSFICQWLFSTGHYIKLLPMLALHLYCVGPVCRDVLRTTKCKILKMRTLTALGLFTEAVREAVLLTKGAGIHLPHGQYTGTDSVQVENEFKKTNTVLDNTEVLEELVNSELPLGLCTLYGSTLCLHFNLARAQLILAISATIGGPLQVPEKEMVSTDCEEDEAKLLDLKSLQEKLTVGQLKYLLLEAVSRLLNTVTKQLALYSHVDRVELAVESSLLKSKLYSLKGQAVLSAEMAKSSLMLLQSSSENTKSIVEQNASPKPGSEGSECCLEGDSVENVQSSERIGCLLWIRCRLTLVHCLTAHNLNHGGQEDNQSKRDTAQVIRDGVEECVRWGDPSSKALFMLEGVKWDSRTANKSSQIQEIVSVLSGQQNMPPHSVITLAQAALLLNEMKTPESKTFLKLSQMLLQNLLCSFSSYAVLDDEDLPCSSGYCLPFLNLLLHTTSCIGQITESFNQRD